MLSALAFVYGAMYGSFLNVVVHRLPKDQSLIRPRSRCPSCGKPIAWYDNVPVLSWLLLRGRCRACRKSFSVRYPLVEALMGVLSVVAWRHWGHRPGYALAVTLALGALLALSLIDWETFLIPDELSVGLLVLGLLAAPVNPWLETMPAAPWWKSMLLASRGAALGLALGWALAEGGELLFRKEALGGGDVKLLAAVGAWGGLTGAWDCLMIGAFLGTLYAASLLLRGKVKRGDPIPFGPFLAAGAALNLFWLAPFGWPAL